MSVVCARQGVGRARATCVRSRTLARTRQRGARLVKLRDELDDQQHVHERLEHVHVVGVDVGPIGEDNVEAQDRETGREEALDDERRGARARALPLLVFLIFFLLFFVLHGRVFLAVGLERLQLELKRVIEP